MLKNSLIALAVVASSSAFAGTTIKSVSNSEQIRIVGGNETQPHFRSYQVSVQDTSGYHFCGGSLVGDDLVLTAAHCLEDVDGENPNMQVRVGAHSLTDGSGQAIQVAKTYTNQDYPNLSKDVAILKLSEKITDPKAKPIQLADQSFFDANISAGTTLTVSGWGTLSSGGQSPDKLMEVDVPFVTNEICNSSEAYGGQVQDTEMCAGFKEGGKDSCQGDSGGPLVVAHNNSFVQVGVVSWGDGCAAKDKYGVYANVAALKDWIDSAMAGNEPASGASGGDGGGDDGQYPDEDQTFLAFQEIINYNLDDEAMEFVLEVPEGINVLYIATKGGEGDVDITAELLNNDDQESEFDFGGGDWGYYDIPVSYYVSDYQGNDEMIVIEFPSAGEWKVSLSNHAEYQDVELTVFAH